ncbi:MAG: hypothetical protein NTV68_15450 [Methanomicrobiales archaeon]|nr:hypothetical protein [Methanomicrobiales archaeon]
MRYEKVLLWLVIIANITMFSYSMIYYPYRCQENLILSGGAATCALNVGGYLIGIGCCLVATAAALLLISEK